MKAKHLILPLLLALGTAHAAPLDDFENHLRHDLDGRCVGYGYAIYEGGNYVRGGGGGFRKAGDPNNQFDPGLPFDENTVKDVHSMSKVITAAAVLKALGDSGVALDSPIWPYMPEIMQDATPGGDLAEIQTITFRNLLDHTSGFGGSANYSWGQIKSQLSAGLKNNVGDEEYCNWGYALCRLLIPYVLDLGYCRDFEDAAPAWTEEFFLPGMCANHYFEFVNDEVFAPAGLPTIHPRPVNSTIGNFGWYYDFLNPASGGVLMPDRRLTVGSGGWALSAKQYGRFLSGLFNNQIVSGTQLGWMRDGDLGMENIDPIGGGDDYRYHNGATNIGDRGGRSFWMHFPDNNMQVAIQINSARNDYSAYGLGLNAMVRDAYERAYSTPPWSQQWARHIFVRRAGDGWTAGRGVDGAGDLGDRNYDGHIPAGFTHARFFDVGGKPFVLHYKPVNGGGKGRAVMQEVNADGTMGATVFDSPNWLQGWTHVETFKTWQGTFLLLHNHDTGRIRTLPISPLGTVGAAITDHVYSSGFEIAEIIDFGAGDPHLFRHNPQTGQTHLRVLNNDGSVGGTQYDHVWSTDFSDFAFYRAGNTNYLLRYDRATGQARINSFGQSLNGIQLVLNGAWSPGWTNLRFFEVGNTTYNFRYNPDTGWARTQEINANGTFGDLSYESTKWLRAQAGNGPFDPPTTGWTEVEFYDATPGFLPPGTVATNPYLPPAETGPALEPLPAETAPLALDPETLPEVKPSIVMTRGVPELFWPTQPGVLYVLEESDDLRKWRFADAITGDGDGAAASMAPDPATGLAPKSFFRVRAMADLTESPEGTAR